MQYFTVDARPNDLVRVTLDRRANVRLVDATNFNKLRCGQSYRYHGGYATKSPVTLSPPRPGRWYVVVDLGGARGRVKVGVQVVRAAAAR